jgi:hypothetical protein
MATINRMKSTNLALTEPITARAQTAYLFSPVNCLFSRKGIAHAKNKESKEKKSLSPDHSLNFYMENVN